jgi:hypothetical protein
VKAGEHGQIVSRGQQQVGRLLLNDHGNPPSHVQRCADDVVTGDQRPSGSRSQQRRQDLEGRRLPCPVGSQQPEDRSGGNREAEAIDGKERRPAAARELLDEVVDFDGRWRHSRSSLAAGPSASARSINSELRRDRAEALAKAGTPAAN